jgi:hypothetical protein
MIVIVLMEPSKIKIFFIDEFKIEFTLLFFFLIVSYNFLSDESADKIRDRLLSNC